MSGATWAFAIKMSVMGMRRRNFGVWGAVGAVAAAAFWTSAVAADLRVTVSIPPAHSLVAQVMEGVGEPQLLLSGGASPHHFAMRPSHARTLQNADVVFWIGPGFEGWMARPVASLPEKTVVISLGAAQGLTRRTLRKGGVWERHSHDADAHEEHSPEKHTHDAHAHDKQGDHSDHRHDDHTDHSNHERKAVAHGRLQWDDHTTDQHFWLDPKNAAAWIERIVRVLVERDPSNAERYKANAFAALQNLAALEERIEAILAPVRAAPFIVFHDAYLHFEARFGLNAAGSISLPDAGAPGPARLAAIREKIAETGAICVFTEPQFPSKLARMATGGTAARIGELDPIGTGLKPGPEQYDAMMMALAKGLRDCLKG